ncbi:hypothetical protein GCM10011578_094700 [Streptomyces fuscichromogenes]|uniref:Uncharacterized protein n=1 Tax=Streptomyces fuscichromogenes TaxID=1324013 RepID=A0A917XNQ0_9ACTN|nr:hypothetical protein GCM10011578_094700 [Streptomyces fuscichromogenes]
MKGEIDLGGMLRSELPLIASQGHPTEIFEVTPCPAEHKDRFAKLFSRRVPFEEAERAHESARTPGAAEKIVVTSRFPTASASPGFRPGVVPPPAKEVPSPGFWRERHPDGRRRPTAAYVPGSLPVRTGVRRGRRSAGPGPGCCRVPRCDRRPRRRRRTSCRG